MYSVERKLGRRMSLTFLYDMVHSINCTCLNSIYTSSGYGNSLSPWHRVITIKISRVVAKEFLHNEKEFGLDPL